MPKCSANNCGSHYNKGMRMFSFPRNDRQRIAAWIEFCNRDASWVPDEDSRLCHLHFSPSHYEGRKKLDASAIPVFKSSTQLFKKARKRKSSDKKQTSEKLVAIDGSDYLNEVSLSVPEVESNPALYYVEPPSAEAQEYEYHLSEQDPDNIQKQADDQANAVKKQRHTVSLLRHSRQQSSSETQPAATQVQNSSHPPPTFEFTYDVGPEANNQRYVVLNPEETSKLLAATSGSNLPVFSEAAATDEDVPHVSPCKTELQDPSSWTPKPKTQKFLNILRRKVDKYMANLNQQSAPQAKQKAGKKSKGKKSASRDNLSDEMSDYSDEEDEENQEKHVARKCPCYKTIRKLQYRLRKQEASNEALRKNLTKFLHSDQIKFLERKSSSNPVPWTEETLDECMKLRFDIGVRSYEFLRKKNWPLPSYRTLNRKLNGTRDELLDEVRALADDASDVVSEAVTEAVKTETSEDGNVITFQISGDLTRGGDIVVEFQDQDGDEQYEAETSSATEYIISTE